MKKLHVKHLWIMLGAYGIWFAIFSGLEEVVRGKYWKFLLSLVLGILIFIRFEKKYD